LDNEDIRLGIEQVELGGSSRQNWDILEWVLSLASRFGLGLWFRLLVGYSESRQFILDRDIVLLLTWALCLDLLRVCEGFQIGIASILMRTIEFLYVSF